MINDKGYSARPDVQDNLKKRRRWGFLQRLYAGLARRGGSGADADADAEEDDDHIHIQWEAPPDDVYKPPRVNEVRCRRALDRHVGHGGRPRAVASHMHSIACVQPLAGSREGTAATASCTSWHPKPQRVPVPWWPPSLALAVLFGRDR